MTLFWESAYKRYGERAGSIRFLRPLINYVWVFSILLVILPCSMTTTTFKKKKKKKKKKKNDDDDDDKYLNNNFKSI